MGLAVYRRERLYDIERDDAMNETAALAFAGKVEIVADESLLEFFPATFPAEVEVTAGGKTLRKRVTAAYGDPAARSTTPRSRTRRSEFSVDVIDRDHRRSALPGSTANDGCKRLADAMWMPQMRQMRLTAAGQFGRNCASESGGLRGEA